MPSGQELIIVVIVIALIFGASRLPLLGRNLGQGIKEFKKGVKEVRNDGDDAATAKGDGDTAAPDATRNGAAPNPDAAAKRND